MSDNVLQEFCLASVEVLAQAFLKWNNASRKDVDDYLTNDEIAVMDITELSFMQAKDLMYYILIDVPIPRIENLNENNSQGEGAGVKLPASPA